MVCYNSIYQLRWHITQIKTFWKRYDLQLIYVIYTLQIATRPQGNIHRDASLGLLNSLTLDQNQTHSSIRWFVCPDWMPVCTANWNIFDVGISLRTHLLSSMLQYNRDKTPSKQSIWLTHLLYSNMKNSSRL